MSATQRYNDIIPKINIALRMFKQQLSVVLVLHLDILDISFLCACWRVCKNKLVCVCVFLHVFVLACVYFCVCG